jgi:hypothetical protein
MIQRRRDVATGEGQAIGCAPCNTAPANCIWSLDRLIRNLRMHRGSRANSHVRATKVQSRPSAGRLLGLDGAAPGISLPHNGSRRPVGSAWPPWCPPRNYSGVVTMGLACAVSSGCGEGCPIVGALGMLFPKIIIWNRPLKRYGAARSRGGADPGLARFLDLEAQTL